MVYQCDTGQIAGLPYPLTSCVATPSVTMSRYVERILESTELMSSQHRAWKPPLGDVCFRRKCGDPPLQSAPLSA